jgi:hypothetical protein
VEPRGATELARAYSVKMRADAVFVSLTAARLWGLPLPSWIDEGHVHVATPHGSARPGGRGVRGSQFTPEPDGSFEIDGLRVLSPALTWASLSRDLGLADLVAVGDALVTPGFGSSRSANCHPEDLVAVSRRKFPGSALAGEAAPFVRIGALSRPESLTRVALVTGGLPQPECNFRASPLLMFDLAWPDWKVALDYHGANHRSASQYARDVGRRELAAQHGWDLIQITFRELFDSPLGLLATVRSHLSAKGAPVRVVDPRHVALARP